MHFFPSKITSKTSKTSKIHLRATLWRKKNSNKFWATFKLAPNTHFLSLSQIPHVSLKKAAPSRMLYTPKENIDRCEMIELTKKFLESETFFSALFKKKNICWRFIYYFCVCLSCSYISWFQSCVVFGIVKLQHMRCVCEINFGYDDEEKLLDYKEEKSLKKWNLSKFLRYFLVQV